MGKLKGVASMFLFVVVVSISRAGGRRRGLTEKCGSGYVKRIRTGRLTTDDGFGRIK